MVLLSIGLIMVSLTIPGSKEADACEVLSIPPIQDTYNNSTAVFSGKVARIQDYTVESFGDWHLVSFDVDRYWKLADENADYKQIILFTAPDSGACGYNFEVGETYLVYAIKWWHDPNQLYTSIGYRNQPIEDAQKDLAFLGEGSEPASQSSWGEQISRIEIKPLPKPLEESRNMMLSIVGIGVALAGAAAFLSLRGLKKR